MQPIILFYLLIFAGGLIAILYTITDLRKVAKSHALILNQHSRALSIQADHDSNVSQHCEDSIVTMDVLCQRITNIENKIGNGYQK